MLFNEKLRINIPVAQIVAHGFQIPIKLSNLSQNKALIIAYKDIIDFIM